MDLYQVIKTRRSIRSYRPDPVPEEKLNRVLEAARLAPSGNNRQPWKFILVRDEKIKRGLVPLVHHQSFVAQAPLVVVACGENIHYSRGGYMGDFSMLVDVSIAVDHLTLAARAEGLGTCWIGSFDNSRIKQYLGIPHDFQVVALTPIGFPEGEVFIESTNRKGLSEIICYERFS